MRLVIASASRQGKEGPAHLEGSLNGLHTLNLEVDEGSDPKFTSIPTT